MIKNLSNIFLDMDWILRDSETGFYLLVASEQGQQEILSHYADDKNICVYDIKKNAGNYRFADVSDWVAENPDRTLYVLQNLHLALGRYETCQSFNFTRDMLRRLQKNFLFCVTPLAEDRLNRWALDFCGYLKLKLFCEEEQEKKMLQEEPPVVDLSTHIPPPEVDLNGDGKKQLIQAIAWGNQARSFYEDGRYEDALILLDATRRIQECFLEEDHPNLAVTYIIIGVVYKEKAELDTALHWYIKALSVMRRSLSTTFSIYRNIGNIYKEKECYDIALEWHKKSLDITEKIFDFNHPEIAEEYCNIGSDYQGKREYNSALELYQKALVILENVYGENHPDTARVYHNIGIIYGEMDDYDTALDWLQKAESVQEYVLPKNHSDTINTYQAIAAVYEAKGDTVKQQIYLQKIKTAKGENHEKRIAQSL